MDHGIQSSSASATTHPFKKGNAKDILHHRVSVTGLGCITLLVNYLSKELPISAATPTRMSEKFDL